MDIEQLVLLKENLEILADGRDPKTGYQVDDTILKSKFNKQILKDAADILDMLLKIDFNPVKIDRRKKYTFFMSEETKKKIEISSIPISISMFTYSINQHINSNKMKKIKASQITNWLMSIGFLNEIESEDGKKFKKGTVNKQNALFTTILAIDFDGMSYEEFAKEKAKLTALDIETIDIFSGHGFQSIILLEHKVYDKNLLRDFTKLLESRGFKVDSSIVDSARLLRLPYTFNCKGMDPKQSEYYDKHNPEIFPTTDINWTEKRYHVQDIFKKISSMENLKDSYIEKNLDEINIKDIVAIDTEIPTITTPKKQRQVKELKIKIENTKSHYPMISDFDKLPDPVKKMLTETPQGLRNQTIMFLVPFFRNTLGLNIQTIKQIMVVWGEHCTPKMTQEAVETDVDRIYKKGFKGGFGKYTVELRKAYGYLEFNKYTRNNKIIIPNAIFNDFDVISDGAIRIYLSMKLAKSLDDLKELTKEDIQKYADISERTVERNMKDLVSMGYVCKRKENRRLGEKYIYYINPYFSTIEGYTMIENSLVKLMLQELTDGESKLYIYLCKMIGSSKNECWSSQKYIAKNIGKTQQGISLITDKLSEKRYIKKTTLITDDNIKVCTYNLNY